MVAILFLDFENFCKGNLLRHKKGNNFYLRIKYECCPTLKKLLVRMLFIISSFVFQSM